MAKSIMIQGTMSNVGKSLITAGLCRIFQQDGHRVAPFKSQNMALNSYITKDGLEMGRAQVTQAEAAGLMPRVEMNPILLKPTNDIGSQVIVMGEVVGQMQAAEYFRYKKSLIPVVKKAYAALEAEHDILVIEGAGSPAEINLKQADIVNMGLAEMVNAPVLLVGDIDRGGVFAQLYGTIALLESWERKRVQGMIINKFRGDPTILLPGLSPLHEKCGVDILGVLPYLSVDIEEEDSLTKRFHENKAGLVDIAVIQLPRISNFTDFHVLEAQEEMAVRYIRSVRTLGQPDMILLPGSKNTMDDLRWLRQSGLEAAIQKQAAAGTIVFGICGGYQMMGKELSDPFGTEGGGSLRGMGLLPVSTTFAKQKIRRQVEGVLAKVEGALSDLSGLPFCGYEIHMGETRAEQDSPLTLLGEKGEGAQFGNCYGTYVHGIWDELAMELLHILLRKKGIAQDVYAQESHQAYKEKQYDALASAMRQALDIEKIYEIINNF